MINSESDYIDCPCLANRDRVVVYPECGPFGNQHEWLEQDLKNARENSNITWIIAMGHRPMYSTSHKLPHTDFPPLTSEYLRDNFEKLFYDYHVDLYLSGHIHAYERLYPTYKSQVKGNYSNPGATVGITNGAAGCIENHQHHGFEKPWRNFTANIDDTHWGIGILKIYNDSVLHYQFVGSEDGDVLDEVWLKRNTDPWE